MKQFSYYQLPEACAGLGSRMAGNRVAAAILALALGGLGGSAYGASCTVSSSGVNFGVYNIFSTADHDDTGIITVTCTGLLLIGVSYTIRLSTGGSNSYASRLMSDGAGHSLAYNLYTNSSHTTVWGDGTGGTGTVSAVFLLGILTQHRDHDIYGRIFKEQNAYAGSYNDSITITISY